MPEPETIADLVDDNVSEDNATEKTDGTTTDDVTSETDNQEEVTDAETTTEDDKDGGETEEEVSAEDDSTEDFSEYKGQFDGGLGDDINSVDDLAEAYVKLQTAQGADDGSSESANKLAQLEVVLQKAGYSVDGLLTPQDAQQQTTSAGSYEELFTTGEQILKQEIESGHIVGDEYLTSVVRMVDQANAQNRQRFLNVLENFNTRLNGITGTNKKLVNFSRSSQYADYKKTYGEVSLPEIELNKVMDEFPDFDYNKAHAFALAMNPKRFVDYMKKYGVNVEKNITKKKRFAGKFKGIGGGKKSGDGLGSWEKYFTGGEMNHHYDKLSSADQDIVLNRSIAAQS